MYEKVKNIYIDTPLQKGTFRGFFGRCDDSDHKGLIRLGLIWGDLYKHLAVANAMDDASGPGFDYGAQNDSGQVQAPRNDLGQEDSVHQDPVSNGHSSALCGQLKSGVHYPWKAEADSCVDAKINFQQIYAKVPQVLLGTNAFSLLGPSVTKIGCKLLDTQKKWLHGSDGHFW
ncbi:hypothetical protein BGZ60DRAFT_190371 [Tricladium varicosporioides]|nr:hypothetical protein BGZ60DRAFT_190371 [Hymenoscyphus varicosporioides]